MALSESDEDAVLIGTPAQVRHRRCVGVVFVLLLMGGACAGTALAAKTAKAMRFRKAGQTAVIRMTADESPTPGCEWIPKDRCIAVNTHTCACRSANPWGPCTPCDPGEGSKPKAAGQAEPDAGSGSSHKAAVSPATNPWSNSGHISSTGDKNVIGDVNNNVKTNVKNNNVKNNVKVTINKNDNGEYWLDPNENKGLLACVGGKPGDNACNLPGVICNKTGVTLTETGFDKYGNCKEFTDLEKCFCAENGWGRTDGSPMSGITCFNPIALPSVIAIRSKCARVRFPSRMFESGFALLPNLAQLQLGGGNVTGDITKLKIPDHLTQLDLRGAGVPGVKGAFRGNITELKIPDHMTELHLAGQCVTGDITKLKFPDHMTKLDLGSAGVSVDITKLKIPYHMTQLDLYALGDVYITGTGVRGDIAELKIPDHMTKLDLTFAKGLSGDITKLKIPDHMTSLKLCRSGVSGDIAKLKIPYHMTLLDLSQTGVSGDIAELKIPDHTDHMTQIYLDETGVSGDMTKLKIPDNMTLHLWGTDVKQGS